MHIWYIYNAIVYLKSYIQFDEIEIWFVAFWMPKHSPFIMCLNDTLQSMQDEPEV